jgi:TolB protein
VLLLAAGLGACGDSPAAPQKPQGPQGPLRFSIVATPAFVRCGGEVPVTITVTDSVGNPVPGLLLNLQPTTGGGSFFAGSAITNAAGVVKDYWTIGTVPDAPYAFEARAVDPVTGAKQVYLTQTTTSLTRIAFTSTRDGNWEIYVMNPDGSDLRRMTTEPGLDIHPAWSPDGSRLAFVSNRDGNNEIYVMSADGSVQRVTNDPGDDQGPAWLPDGKALTFHSYRGGSGWDLYRINVDGTNQYRLTTEAGSELRPAHSSEGLLAYANNHTGDYEIYTRTPTGSSARRVTTSAGDDVTPAFSPADESIAFASKRDGNWEIYAMGKTGLGVHRLTNDAADDRAPTWSPQGATLAFSSTRDGLAEIYTMSSDGTGVQRITNSPRQDDTPSWSVCTAF